MWEDECGGAAEVFHVRPTTPYLIGCQARACSSCRPAQLSTADYHFTFALLVSFITNCQYEVQASLPLPPSKRRIGILTADPTFVMVLVPEHGSASKHIILDRALSSAIVSRNPSRCSTQAPVTDHTVEHEDKHCDDTRLGEGR